jgi:hypothetical protein
MGYFLPEVFALPQVQPFDLNSGPFDAYLRYRIDFLSLGVPVLLTKVSRCLFLTFLFLVVLRNLSLILA